jgi:hypothetical protein
VPGREYRLDVWYSRIAGRLAVSLDGWSAWSGGAGLYPTSVKEIVLGRGEADMPDVRRFSGELSESRQGILYAAGHAYPVFYP